MRAQLGLLETIIEAARRNIAGQEKLVLRPHTEGQSELAETAQSHLEKMTADLEYLREVRRHVLSDLRRPRASSAPKTWHRILNAIERLQARAPADGERVH
jgi:hypothetical protein